MSVLVGNSAKVPCPFYRQNTAEQKTPICCVTLMLKSMTQKPYEDILIIGDKILTVKEDNGITLFMVKEEGYIQTHSRASLTKCLENQNQSGRQTKEMWSKTERKISSWMRKKTREKRKRIVTQLLYIYRVFAADVAQRYGCICLINEFMTTWYTDAQSTQAQFTYSHHFSECVAVTQHMPGLLHNLRCACIRTCDWKKSCRRRKTAASQDITSSHLYLSLSLH